MSPRRQSALRWSAVVLVLGSYIAGAAWFAGHTPIYHLYKSTGGARVSYEKARVLAVKAEELEREKSSGLDTGYQDLEVRILTGEKKGAELDIRNFLNYTTNIRLRPGSAIIVHMDVADAEHYTVSVYSLDRGPALLALAVIFFAALCGIGGRRGARSVLGIAFTFASIAFLFIPLLYRGCSPTLSAVAVVAATVGVSLVLLGGIDAKTLSAVLGSYAGLAVSALAIVAFQRLTLISGYTTAEADSLLAIGGQSGMKVGELLFAAMLIASSGAIMDVAISVASAVREVRASNPGLTRTRLFASGMNVGRDMMGTMANTLILAFTGASLNTLILIYSLEHSFYQILNSNTIVIEIVEALTGSLAVILTVPAVAIIAALLTRS
ncbi:MAG: YibE/F family protein [Rectinemataceae bacterium]